MLRPNSDYLVAVSMQNTVQSTFVVVEIIGNQDSGGTFKTTDSVSVEPFSTRIVRLEVCILRRRIRISFEETLLIRNSNFRLMILVPELIV